MKDRIPQPKLADLKRFGDLWVEPLTTHDPESNTDHHYDLVYVRHHMATGVVFELIRIDDREAIKAAIAAATPH